MHFLVFVKFFKILSPVGRFLIYLAPLMAAIVDRVRLFPRMRFEVIGFCIGVAALLICKDFLHYLVFRRKIEKQSQPSEELQRAVNRLAPSFGIKPPRVLVSSACDSNPLTAGVRDPIVVIPSAILSSLNEEETDLLLAHEMAHIQRKDILWKWLLLFLRHLSFLNPAAEWSYRWLNQELEQGSDRLVVSVIQKPGTLARMLLKVEETMSQISLPSKKRMPVLVSRAGTYLPARIHSLASLPITKNTWLTVWRVGLLCLMLFTICYIFVNTWLKYLP